MPIRIPDSSERYRGRRARGYAQLIQRITAGSPRFEGRFFPAGAGVDEAELRPTADYPAAPLLVEFAGTDGAIGGDTANWRHKRLSSVHILWRFNRARQEWDELARTSSFGAEWIHHLAPIVRHELERDLAVSTPASRIEAARAASARVVALLDSELDRLEHEGKSHVMSMIWDQVAARLVETEANNAAA